MQTPNKESGLLPFGASSSSTGGTTHEYVNSEFGVTLSYPKEWIKAEGHMGTVVSFMIPSDPTRTSSLNLIVQELPPEITFSEFSEQSIMQMRQLLQGQESPKIWSAPLFGIEGKRMQFTASMGAGMTMRIFQAWTVQNGNAYIITFSAPSDQHDEYRDQVESLLASLRFSNAAPPKEKPIDTLCLAHYEDSKHLFRIRYPRTWTLSHPTSGSIVRFEYNNTLSPKETVPVSLSIDVSVTALPDPSWNLDTYSEIAGMRLADITLDGETPPKESCTLAGLPAYRVRYRSDDTRKGGLFLQAYTLKDGQVFNVTACAVADEDDKRPEPLFERIITSLEFLQDSDFISMKDFMVYEHLIYKIGIVFSSEWRVSTGMGTLVTFEHGGDSEHPFDCNVNLVVTDTANETDDAPQSLDDLTDVVKSQLHNTVENVNIIEEDEITFADRECRKITYEGDLVNRKFKFQQRFILKGTVAYVISFSSLESNYEREILFANSLFNSCYLF